MYYENMSGLSQINTLATSASYKKLFSRLVNGCVCTATANYNLWLLVGKAKSVDSRQTV